MIQSEIDTVDDSIDKVGDETCSDDNDGIDHANAIEYHEGSAFLDLGYLSLHSLVKLVLKHLEVLKV